MATSNGVPKTLREARKQAGLKQREVADHADCVVSLVSMVENGYRAAPVTLARMADAVGASYGSFWDVT